MKTQLEKDKESLKIARQELDWKHAEVERLENAINYGRCALCNSPLMFDEKQYCGDYPNCEEFLEKDDNSTDTTLNWIEEQLKKHESLKYNSELWKGEGHTLTNSVWNRALNQERNMGEYEILVKIKKLLSE